MNDRGSKLLMFSWILKKGYEKSLQEVLIKYKLSQVQGNILLFLYNNELNTAKDISEYRSISKSLVSKSIDNLYEKKYIYIKEDRDDKRINRLYLTDKSKNVVKSLHLAQRNFFKLLEKDIEKDDLLLMDKTLKKLYNNIYENLK
ncbi:MAG: winged helix-turn-helix transcriptional regulator [Clostridium sp.]|nr:winged helix-turn-helix transcriptional regulator [Clostridium sp.]